MADIEIHQLFEKYHKKQQRRIRIYEKIYNKIIYKIKSISNKGWNTFATYFVIPEYQFGCPLYDQTTCIAYSIIRLRKIGFDVKYTHPNFIYISWHKFINTYKFKTQSLIDTSKKTFNYYNNDSPISRNIVTKPRKIRTFFKNLNDQLIDESERAERSNNQIEILNNIKNRANLLTRFS